ncbi:MAG: 4-alpha-glucanotransferase [Methanospirillum sp.]
MPARFTTDANTAQKETDGTLASAATERDAFKNSGPHALPLVSVMMIRGSGLLLHITSLPSRFGIGDLGPAAYRFADLLAAAGQTYWQVLPLNPTVDTNPYHGTSAFAKNPLLISPELLAADGLVDPEEIDGAERFPGGPVDFARVVSFRERLFDLAWARFAEGEDRREFAAFCREHAWWLDDFALFSAIHSELGGLPWSRWPDGLRRREPGAVREAAEQLRDRADLARFIQFVFMRQWQRLRAYCREREIRIIGDIPIYMDYDSADVWLHPEYFELDDELRPTAVSGTPPDVFNAAGQRWGHPLYRWDALERDGFAWWTRRMERTLSCVDYVRIDHFRGLVAYWAVPAGSATATEGRWVPAPVGGLLGALARRFPCLPIVAEDLGTITPDVREVMAAAGIPGMKVLLLAFEEFDRRWERNINMPHNAVRDCVLYTGTHDTNTVRGWAEDEATDEHRERLRQYFGREIPPADLPREFVRLAMSTVANTVILPVQDVLGLGSEGRMNRPGTAEGNWTWRLEEEMLTAEIVKNLRAVTRVFARD